MLEFSVLSLKIAQCFAMEWMDGLQSKREKNAEIYVATREVPDDALVIKFKKETIVVSNIPMQRSIIHHE